MPVFGFLWGIFQLVLMLSVAAISVEYYDPTLLPMPVPDLIWQVVLYGVLGTAAFWCVLMLLGGSIFGLAVGGTGTQDLQMGLLLGLGAGLARLWPHTLAWGVGCFAAAGPLLHVVAATAATIVFLAIHIVMKFFWGSIHDGVFGS